MWMKNLVKRIANKSSMDYTSLSCCALAFVLYLNTLNSGFVYDDRRAILSNTDVSGSTPWQQAFLNDYWGTPLTDSGSHGSYRPLCVLSFRLNFLMGGYSPWGYHLINNLMHCLATGLVVKLARLLLSSVWGVLATGALFAAHPIHTEAVAGIVGRADLAACIFYLLTYLTYSRHMVWRERSDGRQWLALALTVLLSWVALLFKETAITALLVCGLFDGIRGICGLNDKRRLRSLGIMSAALLCTVYSRLVMLPRPQSAFSSADNPIAKTNSLWTRFLTFLYLPVFNFKLLINPQVLSFDWGMDAIPRITSIWDSRNYCSLFFYSSLAVVVWSSCRVLVCRWMSDKRAHHRPTGIQYQKQHHHNHRKSRSKKKYQTPNNSPTIDASYSAVAATTHLQYAPHECMPLVKQPLIPAAEGAGICRDCKHCLRTGHHTTACRTLNNNNNNNNSLYSDCSCHQLLSSTGAAPHLIALALQKTAQHLTPRSSRSSSSCSNSTTASSKSCSSSGSCASSCGSTTSSSSSFSSSSNGALSKQPAARSRAYLLHHMSTRTANSSVLLTAVAFLTLPFLPATNLFFYVGFVVAERLLYLPSVGYCLLVGFGIAKLMDPLKAPRDRRRKLALLLCMSVALSMLSVRTMRRNLDWRDEESLYRSAVTVNPPKALGNLGSVLSSQARYAEAEEALLEAIKFRPNMADVHFNLGIVHQNQQNYDAAVENFQRAIQYRPNLAVAYLNLGTSLIAVGKCGEATRVLLEGTKLDGGSVRDRAAHESARMSSYLQLGALYAEQGKLQRALAVYREALHPKSAPAAYYQREVLHQRIGDILGRLQQWDEAEKHHRAALQIRPDHVAAHLSYGITLARNSSRAAEAELWFKRALQLAPQQASVFHHYAEFLAGQARSEESIFYRLRAAELSPDDYSLVVAAATALRLVERKVEAEQWYRKAVSLRPGDARAHTNLGAILHLLGHSSHAAASYREALRLQPGDPTTMANLAKLGVAESK